MNTATDMDTLSHPDKVDTVKISPRYDTSPKGVFYVGVKPDGDEMKYQEPERLADTIYLIGRGIDADSNHYRIIQWQDRITRQTMTDAIDTAGIGSNQGWQALQAKGLTILANRRKRDLLADYLQTQGGNEHWQVTIVALSVWGKADDLKLGWRGTDLGFSNVANARNDGLLVLDEVGEAPAKVVSMTAYSVLNGKGKIQGAKEGGNRAINEWRVLVLSTGEQTLEAYLNGNNTDLHAGQAARLPSIPADAGKGHGIFDVLHGFTDGALFSEHLNIATNQYYGTAGRAFIDHLLADVPTAKTAVQTAMSDFLALLPELSHQARRVGTRFALVAAALVLAKQYGILPKQTDQELQAAIKQCFDAWLEREGTGKREDRRIIEQAKGFMQVNANSRFERLPLDAIPHAMPNLAGYKEPPKVDSGIMAYYVIPDVFSNEIAKGFDTAKVCEVLHAANEWLQKPNGRWQKQKRINGELQRFYVLVGTVPMEPNTSQEE